MKNLFNINPRYSTVLASIIGLLLIDDLSVSEQNMLGEWMMLIAQTIVTNANSQHLIETEVQNNNININSKEIKSIYNPILYNIDKLKSILKTIYPNNKECLEDISSYLSTIKDKIDKIKID